MYTTIASAFILSALALLFAANPASAASSQQAGAHAKPMPRQGGFTSIAKKKGGSGVDLAYQFAGTPEVGKPLLVQLQMTSPADAQVTVRAGEGLQLQTKELVMRSAAGTTAKHEMSVMPLTEGRHYIHVQSTARGRTTASAIAVQVGKDMPMAKPAGDVKTMPSGERVISVPAQ
jgi:hypothetical protein